MIVNYEECNLLEEAVKLCDKTILHDLKCQRGVNIGYAFGKRVYCSNRMSVDASTNKQGYQQAYLLMKLMKKESQMMRLSRKYAEWYGEDICANEA